jgi:ATP-dependent helicase HrpA/adenine-specific DNA-methyltransferase
LRSRETDAEAKLWQRLRDRRLSGEKFRRQHPLGRYVLDFFAAEVKLAVELDGGGHIEPAQAAYDRERTKNLNRSGIQVIRFPDDDVLLRTDAVLESIAHVLDERRVPHPNPLPPGEGSSTERP